jgi:hypothetical protein
MRGGIKFCPNGVAHASAGVQMNNWRFVQSASGYWLWQHTDSAGAKCASTRCFDTRTECIADAFNHGFDTNRGTIMAESQDEFSWSDETLVVVKRVDAIAVYRNPEGDIIVRQERRGGEEDNVVIVPGQYAYTLVESIQRLLKGQLFSLSADPR